MSNPTGGKILVQGTKLLNQTIIDAAKDIGLVADAREVQSLTRSVPDVEIMIEGLPEIKFSYDGGNKSDHAI